MKLYGFYRSSASYRVRIALALKGVDYEQDFVNLARGENLEPAWAGVNPFRFVPVLENDGPIIVQSLAIMEYLDETHPEPPLLPAGPAGRARVRGIALVIACEVHPLDNPKVLRYLTDTLGVDEPARDAWYHHWIEEGFRSLEETLAASPDTGTYCHGETPTLADCCLVPQMYNARRFEVDLEPYPTLGRIDAACRAHPAFEAARPENQPDAP